jgi:hypothetical protein
VYLPEMVEHKQIMVAVLKRAVKEIAVPTHPVTSWYETVSHYVNTQSYVTWFQAAERWPVPCVLLTLS